MDQENATNQVDNSITILGLGEIELFESKVPKKIESLSTPSIKIFKIACGGMHTLVLTSMGKVFTWGCNDDFALGRSGSENIPTEMTSITVPINNIAAGDSHSVALNTDLNVLYYWGQYRVIKIYSFIQYILESYQW